MTNLKPALAVLLAAALLAGCGIQKPTARSGGAQLRVTRDFGHTVLGEVHVQKLPEGESVSGLLTRGPALEALRRTGTRGWSFFVNGVASRVAASDYRLRPGDRLQWDHRDRGAAAAPVQAIVGSFPEPFLHGFEGKRRPVRVECDDAGSAPCDAAQRTLDGDGVPTSSSSIGAPGTEAVTRLVVARWPRARIVRGASTLEQGPEASGVFARFVPGGRALQLLDDRGRVVRTARPGDGTALVAALRSQPDELVWLVTALDDEGLAAGVRALDEHALSDAFAVAVAGGRVEKLPLRTR
jgi:hypothetical protein